MTTTVRTETPAEYTTASPQPTLDLALIDRAKQHLLSHLRIRRTEDTAYTQPGLVMDYFQLHFTDAQHEIFSVMFLNSKHQLITVENMFRGTLDSASVYPREVVKAALHHNAGAVILAHNHPSGDLDPSDADRRITTRLVDALTLVGVRTLDHIVVGEGCMSFAEAGYL